jgi:hypothetical protein
VSVRHPNVSVRLTGQDGNIFSIIGRVNQALRRAGVSSEERSRFSAEIMESRDYNEALRRVMTWVEVS